MRELHEFCLSICLQLILKRNTKPLKHADVFFFLSQSTRITIQGVIWRYDVRKSDVRTHFNDTNGKYNVWKSRPEVILMIQTEDTTYWKNCLEVILMIQTEDTTYEKAALEVILMIQTVDCTKKLSVILMIQTEDTTYEKAIWKSF